jgi:Photosynthetic reaction centre cytochrome C subunit
MKKTALITTAFTGMIALSLAFTKADEPRYKNLKVMPKSTTKQQMDSVMKHFTASLGVKCNHCHVYNQAEKSMDFASDANEHKDIARDMMRMTSKINKKYFDVKDSKSLEADLEMTCYTCHNGKAHPSKWPAKGQPGQQGQGNGQRAQAPPPPPPAPAQN